ncbi:hypothetical protein HPP92_017926 [Vanilla planifolia]|uniref:DNA-directed RNA polymerase III subunit RPC4 n=1 Tax=Vanilla planifolia TaxID=51239 RepID=A0A835UNY2_VANPL|nr:hypothetical protein HPP92_017926 [Vanilla planifolia]
MKNESGSGSGPPTRKWKFAPKVPTCRKGKPALVKKELSEIKDDIVDKELLAKLKSTESQDHCGRMFKAERKATPAEVTFGHGNLSTQLRSYGTPKDCKFDDSGLPQSKEYVEPWDYGHSHYPVMLPMRRPYSGDPEILDKMEFGEPGRENLSVNENLINAAQKLGLMETSDEPKMVFLQFPTRLPSVKPSDEEKVPGNKTTSVSRRGCKLKDFPAGSMGKLLVYKSGKVKMKLGDVLFDVSPGADHLFAEQIVAVNAEEKQFCVLGELNTHAVVTPDVDSMLEALDGLDE